MHWPIKNNQAMFREIMETCHNFLIWSRPQFVPGVMFKGPMKLQQNLSQVAHRSFSLQL